MADDITARQREGCSVIQDDRVRENCESLFQGRFSLRGYFGTDFSEISDGCENPNATQEEVETCKLVVNRGVRRIEDLGYKKPSHKCHN